MGTAAKSKKRLLDMTEGNTAVILLRFAFPLLLGNLFQQLYNMVDTWVIGQTGNNGAYAAVGSVGPIINILIGFFSGFSTGAGVLISQYFGAGDEKKCREAVHTALTATAVIAVVFTLVGVFMSPMLLSVMLHSADEADSVYPFAKQYLTIYFAGIWAMMFYNIGAGILRAVGDSTRPFYFLLVSAFLNVVLDLLFVFQFKMGVAGVALATVIGQVVSGALVMLALYRSERWVNFRFRECRIHQDHLNRILRVGIPSGLQLAITAFSNVFVQSYISGVESAGTIIADKSVYMSGWTTYSKLDQMIFLPIQSLGLAATTFVGQNLGKGNTARAKKGTTVAWALASGITVVLIVILMAFASPLARIFNSDPTVVRVGVFLIRNLTPFYLFCCVNQVFAAALRGAGNSRAPMIILLSSFVGFRQVYLYIASHISNSLLPIAFSYPAGWAVCCTAMLLYYRKTDFTNTLLQ